MKLRLTIKYIYITLKLLDMSKIAKLLIAISLLASFYSCNEETKSSWQIIEEKEDSELAKGIINDTIFLGFYFGMTEEQVQDKFKELVKNGKISVNDKNEYQYDFSFDYPKKANANFIIEYFNGKLYQMRLKVSSEELMNSQTSLLFLRLKSLFRDKYGIETIKTEPLLSKEKGIFDYYWINGNRKIRIYDYLFSEVVIEYSNIKAEREFKKQEVENKEQQMKVMKNDL